MEEQQVDHTDPDKRMQEERAEQHEAFAAQQKPRRSRSKPLLIVLLVVVVALLAGAAGVLGYKALYEKTDSKSQTAATPVSPDKVTHSPANVLVDSLSHMVKGTSVPTKVDASNNIVTTKTGDFGLDGAPIAQGSNGDFFTAVANFSHLTVASNTQTTIANDAMTADNYLLSQGLTADSNNWDSQSGDSTVHFHSTATICTVSMTSLSLAQGTSQVTITCADKAEYDQTAKTLQPVYAAYVAAKPNQKTSSLYFYGLVTDSQTDGYKTASIQTGNYFSPIGGSVALLYQTPDGQWHYFQNTQNTLACEQFNTKQLTDAFASMKCIDQTSGQESSVKTK